MQGVVSVSCGIYHGRPMLRKTMIALLAVTSIAIVSPTVAFARGGGGGFGGGTVRGGRFYGGSLAAFFVALSHFTRMGTGDHHRMSVMGRAGFGPCCLWAPDQQPDRECPGCGLACTRSSAATTSWCRSATAKHVECRISRSRSSKPVTFRTSGTYTLVWLRAPGAAIKRLQPFVPTDEAV
jgi:hypothetical protein